MQLGSVEGIFGFVNSAISAGVLLLLAIDPAKQGIFSFTVRLDVLTVETIGGFCGLDVFPLQVREGF